MCNLYVLPFPLPSLGVRRVTAKIAAAYVSVPLDRRSSCALSIRINAYMSGDCAEPEHNALRAIAIGFLSLSDMFRRCCFACCCHPKKRTTLPKASFFWYFSNTGQIRLQANPMAMAGRLDFSCKRIFAFICNAFCRIKRVFPCPWVVNWVWVSGSVVEFRHSQGWEWKKNCFWLGKKRLKRFFPNPHVFLWGKRRRIFLDPFPLEEKKQKKPFFGWGRNIPLTQKTNSNSSQGVVFGLSAAVWQLTCFKRITAHLFTCATRTVRRYTYYLLWRHIVAVN